MPRTYKSCFWGVLLLMLIVSCQSPTGQYPEGAITRFADLEREFLAPPSAYGTIPFFVLNEITTPEGIASRLEDFKAKGCGGVIFHPRPGLVTEYVSDEWYELFRFAVDKGKELGMEVWIYDENSYPSGFAGGHVPAQMPESYNQGQGLTPEDATTVPADYDKYYMILKKTGEHFTDVTQDAASEVGQAGQYILLTKTFYRVSGWFGGFSYVDMLYPGVTEKFIEVTMPGYEKVAGDEFGKSVPGLFTDEPEINTPGGIRWTPDLFEVFESHWGYDLIPMLPSLWSEEGDWKRVRHNYTQTLLRLFIERYSIPMSEYLASKNLKFTGHYWEHGWPSMRLGGDNMAMYAYHDLPGIDMLFNQFNEVSPNAQFGNIRAVKELASVANQFGRHRTLSETYGGAGWEITFRDLKRLGDWEYALGVNLMNQHLSYYSIAGARKYDYPPSFAEHNPWWKSYGYLNHYYARLSLALSSGRQENSILVIEPTTSAWLYDSYLPYGRNAQFTVIGTGFQAFVTHLEKSKVEYDLGSENIIHNHGSVDKGKFTVGRSAYSVVVIPPDTESLDQTTFELLKTFLQAGGKVVTFSTPDRIDGALNDDIQQFFASAPANLIAGDAEDIDASSIHLQSATVRFEMNPGGNLYHHRRVLEDGQVIFLANSSMEEIASGQIITRGAKVLAMNAFTGEIFEYPATGDGKAIRFEYALPPAESLLLFVASRSSGKYPALPVKSEMEMVFPMGETIISADWPNVLPIDFVDLEIQGKNLRALHTYTAATEVFKAYGFAEGNPWSHQVQYRTTILDKGDFDAESGFSATYQFTIGSDFDFSGMQAVVERPHLYRIAFNGTELSPIAGEQWIDESFGKFDIGNLVKAGENRLTLTAKPMHIHAEIEPVYLLGNFSVKPAPRGWTVEAPVEQLTTGSWKSQGYPFYAWDISYSKQFDISNTDQEFAVALGKWEGTVAEVYVNGSHAGTIALRSDEVIVTPWITPGTNSVEVKITGSLKNTLGPHHNNPAPGLTSPWTWRNVTSQAPGEAYQLLDYGLMTDFYLKEGGAR